MPCAIAAVAQPFGGTVAEAFGRIERTLARARARGAAMVVFPESTLGGYMREPVGDEPGPLLPPALDPDGPEIARLVELAGDLVVCAGYTEAGPDRPYSSAVCVSGDGVLGRHRKVHVPPAERFAYRAGDGFCAFDTPVGRMGMLLCYDKLFPEAARSLVLDGAEIVACMAAWPVDRRNPSARVGADRQTRHFDVLDVARAVENQVVVGVLQPDRALGPAALPGTRQGRRSRRRACVASTTGTGAGMAVARGRPRAAVEAARFEHRSRRRPNPACLCACCNGIARHESMVEPMR